MIKSLFSVISSIVITILLFIRLVNAASFSEIVVIGSLAFFTGLTSLYLLFEKRIKSGNLYLKNICGENQVVTYYVATIIMLLLLEIFLIFIPIEGYIFKILKIFLMSFFLAGISALSVLIYYDRKKKKNKNGCAKNLFQ